MRENHQAKGIRYASEGRLTVLSVTPDRIEAVCKGGGETYRLGFRNGSWHCDCAALGRCSHLASLQLVTDVRRMREVAP